MKIEVNHISQIYKGNVKALNDISLNISSGLVGLLGRNGAGKTTLMRILATVLQPSAGEVAFDGKLLKANLQEYRSALGYLPQNTKLMPYMNVFEFMDYMCILKGINNKAERLAESQRCIELVGLENQEKKPLGKFSGGMLRRAGIAQALIGNPKFLIVDEPTTGLDPEEQLYFLNLLSRLGNDCTVLFSTHIIKDIENICEQVCIIDSGCLLYQGSVDALLAKVSGRLWECIGNESAAQALRKKTVVTGIANQKGKTIIRYISDECAFEGSEAITPNLEDAFLFVLGGLKR